MSKSPSSGYFIIWSSFAIALIFQVTPWPSDFAVFRPSWLILVTIYWVLALPDRVNVGTALILGLLWDLILGSTLGVRGLMMSLLIYVVALNFQMIRNVSLWRQAFMIFGLTIAGRLIEFWCEAVVSGASFNVSLLYSGITNFLIWPWLFSFLRHIRQTYIPH